MRKLRTLSYFTFALALAVSATSINVSAGDEIVNEAACQACIAQAYADFEACNAEVPDAEECLWKRRDDLRNCQLQYCLD